MASFKQKLMVIITILSYPLNGNFVQFDILHREVMVANMKAKSKNTIFIIAHWTTMASTYTLSDVKANKN